MPQWVRTDYEWSPHMARLMIGDRDLVINRIPLKQILETEGHEAIRRLITDLIGELRPEWAGGDLISITFKVAPQQWEFTYLHPSLPQSPYGEELPRIWMMQGFRGDELCAACVLGDHKKCQGSSVFCKCSACSQKK